MEQKLNVVKVKLPIHLDGEGRFTYQNKEWYNSTLFTAAIGLEEFDLPLCAIDMSAKPWSMSNFMWILYHMERTQNADLSYPIILTPEGIICDGWHRIARATLSGATTIKAVRLNSMPEPDGTITD